MPSPATGRAGYYTLAPERGREGYDALIRDLLAHGTAPQRIAHFWLVTEQETFRPGQLFPPQSGTGLLSA
jgi:hypothetical protein